MSWLDELVESHEELESPRSFWYWAGLCAISAVVKDNIFLDRWRYKLYPNIYVMLHAASGLKKGPPVGLAKKLVKKINNTKVISGRSSIQGILKELGTARTKPGGDIEKNSVAFYIASEFSSSLVADPAAMTILTDLYDRQYNEGEWQSLLKMESFKLRNPTLSMLVATNDAHFKDFVAKKDMQGGFIGRMFVIAESEVNTLNPLIAPPRKYLDEERLVNYLKDVSKLSGEFQTLGSLEESAIHIIKKDKPTGTEYFTRAGAIYDEWYFDFYKRLREQSIKDTTGTLQRFGDSVLKVAMLLSLSNSLELIITEEDMNQAILVCEKLIGGIRKATLGKDKQSDSNDRKSLAITEMMSRDTHSIARSVLQKNYWTYGDSDEWDQSMVSLEQAGIIIIEAIGSQIVYRMTDESYVEWSHFFEGKDSK